MRASAAPHGESGRLAPALQWLPAGTETLAQAVAEWLATKNDWLAGRPDGQLAAAVKPKQRCANDGIHEA
jgi:hypothetical protein